MPLGKLLFGEHVSGGGPCLRAVFGLCLLSPRGWCAGGSLAGLLTTQGSHLLGHMAQTQKPLLPLGTGDAPCLHLGAGMCQAVKGWPELGLASAEDTLMVAVLHV